MSPSCSCRAATDRSAGRDRRPRPGRLPRLDQAAELQQMMPVATVPGETGSVEAQHRPHFPGAQPRHQPLEPGRATIPLAERPRSSSITSTSRKPRRRRRRRARTGGAGSRDCSEPGPGSTGGHRRPPCASAPRGKKISARHRRAPPPPRRPPPTAVGPAGRAPSVGPTG